MKRLIEWLLRPSWHYYNAVVRELLVEEERKLNREYPRASSMSTGQRLPDWCTCPNDCDCDGQLVCGAQAGKTLRWCNEPPGHDGEHVSGNHRWWIEVS